jgi:hypothetical protein
MGLKRTNKSKQTFASLYYVLPKNGYLTIKQLNNEKH